MAKRGDRSGIELRLRAQALHSARGCCGNCSRSIEKHDIVLVVVHKVPIEFGGQTEPGNLWALCEECNAGTNCFRRVDPNWIRRISKNRSVHMRLGEALKAFLGEPVPAVMLKFVADQDAWTKRIRELRYLGWKIETSGGASEKYRGSFYRLVKSQPWPTDPTGDIRRYERKRAERNNSKENK